ncbi:hypothetical protein [Microscilla marina]|nr:hypothetical protein [Microscilla marina]
MQKTKSLSLNWLRGTQVWRLAPANVMKIPPPPRLCLFSRKHLAPKKNRDFETGALAYARGNQIELGPGQERHLPHEAWHVVQQKQGRVAPTDTLSKGLPVNNDAALEKEADVMGARALVDSPYKQPPTIYIWTDKTKEYPIASYQMRIIAKYMQEIFDKNDKKYEAVAKLGIKVKVISASNRKKRKFRKIDAIVEIKITDATIDNEAKFLKWRDPNSKEKVEGYNNSIKFVSSNANRSKGGLEYNDKRNYLYDLAWLASHEAGHQFLTYATFILAGYKGYAAYTNGKFDFEGFAISNMPGGHYDVHKDYKALDDNYLMSSHGAYERYPKRELPSPKLQKHERLTIGQVVLLYRYFREHGK